MARAVSNKELATLNKLNNLFKSIPVTSDVSDSGDEDDNDEVRCNADNTFYVKNNIIIFDGGEGLSPLSIIKIKDNTSLSFLQDKIFKINCKDFFNYIKEYGKETPQISYDNNKIEFQTTKADEPFISEYTNEDDIRVKELSEKAIKFNLDRKNKTTVKYKFTDELIDKFKSERIFHLYFNNDNTIDGNINDNKNEFRLDIFHKYFVRIAKTSKVSCNVTDFENNLKYLVFIIETDGIKTYQYFKIITEKITP
jgi:hypothetical protein